MRYETSVVYLEQVPKVTVDTGFDLATFLSFAVTIVIFAIGTWLTIRSGDRNALEQRRIFEESIKNQNESLEKTLNSQESVARQVSIKASRQEWINELRDCCARLVSAILTLNNHGRMRDATTELAHTLAAAGGADGATIVIAWSNKMTELRGHVYDLRFRVELLSNPNEELFVELARCMESAILGCENAKVEDVYRECAKIKSVAQRILKVEWDRTRKML